MDDPARKSPKAKSGEPAAEPTTSARLVAFTIDTGTNQIVKVELVDAAGSRHEPTKEEKASLVKENGKATVEAILEHTFEAGIAALLGNGVADEEEAAESDEDRTLRQTLLRPLIERSFAKRFMDHEVLSRAILGTLIQDAAGPGPPEPKTAGQASPP